MPIGQIGQPELDVEFTFDPEAWRAFDELAVRHGFDTGIELVADILTHPEDYVQPGDPAIAAMAEAMREWSPIAKDVAGYGALIFSGGISDIFVKSIMGRTDEIDASDIATAALELFGAYGFTKAAALFKKIPFLGTRLAPAADDIISSIGKFGITDDVAAKINKLLGRVGKETVEEVAELSVKTDDAAMSIVSRIANYSTKNNISIADAAKRLLTPKEINDFIKYAGAKSTDEIIRNFGDDLASGIGDEFLKGAAATAKAGAEKADETIKATKELGDEALDTFQRALNEGQFTDMKGAVQWLIDHDVTPNFIKSWTKQVGRESGPLANKMLKAFDKTTTAYSGILGNVLGRLRTLPVVGGLFGKMGALGLAGTGVLTVDQIARNANFGAFYVEEQDQLATFAEMYNKADYAGLAKVISEIGLFMAGAGDVYFESTEFAEVWPTTSYSYQQAKQYHTETYQKALQLKIDQMAEAGAWIKDGSNDGWGRPATSTELGVFLTSPEGRQYVPHYEGYYQGLKRTPEGQRELYELWKGGYIPEYLLGAVLVRAFDEAFKQEQANYENLNASALDPEAVISAVMTYIFMSAKDDAWSTAEVDKALKYGNLLYTLIQQGKVADINAPIRLDQLQTKLTQVTGTSPQWIELSTSEMNQKFGAPSSTTLNRSAPTSVLFGLEGINSNQFISTPSGVEVRSVEKGMAVPVRGTLTPEEIRKVAGEPLRERLTPEQLARFEPTGEAAERRKQEQLQYTTQLQEAYRPTGETKRVGDYTISQDLYYSPSGKALTDSEAYLLMELQQGTITIDDAKRLRGKSYAGLVQKGSIVPPEEPKAPAAPATPLVKTVEQKEVPRGGVYGYERLEAREEPVTPSQAGLKALEAQLRKPELSDAELREIYDFYVRKGQSPRRAISEPFQSEAAKEVVFEQLGIVVHEPELPGYGKTYGVGRIQR